MKIAILCFSDCGAQLAGKLSRLLSFAECSIHSIEKFAGAYGFIPHKKIGADMGNLFEENDALIFISACGIAVREIAPHLKNKTVDPAVLVIDDLGRYVIPILSGHAGGANALTSRIAALVGAAPIITTATDGRQLFSCDAWAAANDCAVSSWQTAKEISAAILCGPVAISAEYPLPRNLPSGLVAAKSGPMGIYIGIRKVTPYQTTLRLIPRIAILGIGCRRGIPVETIRRAVAQALDAAQIAPESLCAIASIDVKKEEPGLLAYAQEQMLPIQFFDADTLKRVSGDFTESDFVQKTVGVGNVCERAAVCAGGTLLFHKTVCDGVTVAAAVKDWRIVF